VKQADVIVMAAAVADTSLDLVANPDLLAGLGKQRGKKRSPLLVGFAAETQNVIENARKKLASKKCDLIVANDVAEPGSGFGVDTNRVTLVDTNDATDLPAGPKTHVAHGILDRVVAMLARR
jgi:phosphopantothenoylcysteine decarboxylase/phosphopantothenate--cysteine ligase